MIIPEIKLNYYYFLYFFDMHFVKFNKDNITYEENEADINNYYFVPNYIKIKIRLQIILKF